MRTENGCETGREGLLDAVLSVAKKQSEELAAMRIALQSGDNQAALEHAKVLAGLAPFGRPTMHVLRPSALPRGANSEHTKGGFGQ